MIEFFTDPVLRAPTLGTIFMCIASSLMGVVLFLQKRSLLSEALSHSSYPGACIGICFFAFFLPMYEEWAFLACLAGAFLSAALALKLIRNLEEKERVQPDTALAFILTLFFAFGVTAATFLQCKWPSWSKQVQMLLFGQAATMTDQHIWIYGSLSFLIALFLILVYPKIQAILFDKNFSIAIGLKVRLLEKILFCLLLLSLMIGIRSVGVTLVSGMMIAPAIAARGFSDRLKYGFFLAAFFSGSSALFGNILSVKKNLPIGPMILLVASSFALLSLLFAPKRGLVFRKGRIAAFKVKCLEENILKGIWKKGCFSGPFSLYTRFALWRLKRGGWIHGDWTLTEDGKQKASSIIRLHRLWELYLTQSLGVQAEKVHKTAEEMEHILTPEMEEKLTLLLSNPKKDPHQQPIPEKRG